MTHRLLLPCFLLLLLSFSLSNAQETGEKTKEPSTPGSTSVGSASAAASAKIKATPASAKAKIEQQRQLALSLLVSLANDARSFRDQKLRARTMARVADGLWEIDPDQGRSLFLRAWEAAEI